MPRSGMQLFQNVPRSGRPFQDMPRSGRRLFQNMPRSWGQFPDMPGPGGSLGWGHAKVREASRDTGAARSSVAGGAGGALPAWPGRR